MIEDSFAVSISISNKQGGQYVISLFILRYVTKADKLLNQPNTCILETYFHTPHLNLKELSVLTLSNGVNTSGF